MSNEENTKEVGQEEATVEETPVEETSVEEASVAEEAAPVEEAPTEEAPAEEAPAEEASAEEASAEEAPAEEASAEEEAPAEEKLAEETPTEEVVEEENKPKKKLGLILGITIPCFVLVLLAVAYLLQANYYKECFLNNTYVNGTDVSGKTVDDVKALLQNQVEEYVLTITKANSETEVIKGTDIGISYTGYNEIVEVFEEQEPYLWPVGFFKKNEAEVNIPFTYDAEKLNTVIAALECVKEENQVAPVSATVVYKDGQFVIQDEAYGTKLIMDTFNEAIKSSVDSMAGDLNLEEAGCYVQPAYRKDSAEVIAAKDEMNKYLTASITYSLESTTVTVDKDEIAPWVSVDNNMVPHVSDNGVKGFVNGTLKSKYNTPNRAATLVTPTGKEVSMKNGAHGRTVNTSGEFNQLMGEIKAGKTVTREPLLSHKGTGAGDTVWGKTYIEVDLSQQHMWLIQNGSVTFETDVVTGAPHMSTPSGIFNVLEKRRDKTLRGKPLPNGKPSYLVPVKYWVRVTWSGIGFHDSSSRTAFGGEIYKSNGSHGCINMPPSKVPSFYSKVSVGTPILIHY